MLDIINTELQPQQVLSHVIDGFIIEESLSPFPVAANVLTSDQISLIRKKQQEVLAQEKDLKYADEENCDETNFSFREDLNEDPLATCEQCGFCGPKSSFSSVRFCSLSCARRYAISHSKRSRLANSSQFQAGKGSKRLGYHQKTFHQKFASNHNVTFQASIDPQYSPTGSMSASSFSDCDDSFQSLSDSNSDFTLSPSLSPEPLLCSNEFSPRQPMHWTVDDVCRYICSLPDSSQHADEFRAQEIDGPALLLLHEEHLISSMNLPLGPALKLCAHIDHLREQESC